MGKGKGKCDPKEEMLMSDEEREARDQRWSDGKTSEGIDEERDRQREKDEKERQKEEDRERKEKEKEIKVKEELRKEYERWMEMVREARNGQ